MVSDLKAYVYCEALPTYEKRIDIGMVSKITEPYESSITNVPIMGLPSERSILMDKSVTNTKTFKYTRVCPKNPVDDYTVDSENWSNGFWLFNVQKYLVNRFQMETDGCKVTFRVEDTEKGVSELYPSFNETNAYISGFEMGYSAGNPYELSGDITFKIGSCQGARNGITKITYYSNFSSYTSEIEDDVSFCVTTTADSTSVEEYPDSWMNILNVKGIYPNVKEMWWSTSPCELFDYASSGRYFRWTDDYWEQLPSGVTQVKTNGGDIKLYARYSGFYKKWED